jgi:CelD/BcsL family acetyltransferase involved in cellulose biosynthesis
VTEPTTQRNHGLRVIVVNMRTEKRWEAFLASHPDAVIYQHPGWIRALEKESGRGCIALACEDASGQLRGILPLMSTYGLPWDLGGSRTRRRLSSLPRTPIAGPLANDPDAARALVHAAIERARMDPSLQLELKPRRELEQTADGLVRSPWRQTFVMELPGDPEKLRFGNARNHSRIRWSVNRATKLGVQVRTAETERDLRAWYQLYLETMRSNAVAPRSYRFFEALWRELRPAGLICLLLAEQVIAGHIRLLAGSIILSYGQTACYAFNGCRRDALSFRPNDIIQWHAIHQACRRGLRSYDLGEVAEDHPSLASFKSKWGGTPRRLYRYYSRTAAREHSEAGKKGLLTRAARAIWPLLPLRLTELLGDWIYGRL